MMGAEKHETEKRKRGRKCSITVIRDWLGFFLTVGGFLLSLSQAVVIDIPFSYNITVEIHNCCIAEGEEEGEKQNSDFYLHAKKIEV